jgi:hypothetical protein
MLLGDGLMSTDWTIRFAHDIEGMNKNPRNGRNPFEGTFKLLYVWPRAGQLSLRRG